MKIFIRADGSKIIGIGHLMRCMTLAQKLKESSNCEIIFLVHEIPQHIKTYIYTLGFSIVQYNTVYRIGSVEDAKFILTLIREKYVITNQDWLIVDHYMIDKDWESVLGLEFHKIMVIDDLANRKHNCTLLLDTTVSVDYTYRYENLLSPNTIKLLGPHYALLRDEFSEMRNKILSGHMNKIKGNILICFGGTDPTNETEKVIRALEPWVLKKKFQLTVIMGSANPHISKVEAKYGATSGINLSVQPHSIALEMSKAELAICAGGTMTWERYCLGLPGLVIAVADNQINIAKEGERQRIDKYLGEASEVQEFHIDKALMELLYTPHRIMDAAKIAWELVDGEGAARVSQYILSL